MASDSVEWTGQRVRAVDDGSKGSIRYWGPVAEAKDTSAIWLGVEWDVSSHRGRHDGRGYYTCATGRGSFVKPEAVVRGVSLRAAVEQRYGCHGSPGNTELPNVGVPVELVLKNDDGPLLIESIKRVVLAGEPVAWIDYEMNLRNVETLVLDDTLLDDWAHIAILAQVMPRLRELHLSKNGLDGPFDVPNLWTSPFLSLKVLQLNRVAAAWPCVTYLLQSDCLPVLEELFICDNRISSMAILSEKRPSPEAAAGEAKSELVQLLPHLKILDLSANHLSDWAHVVKSIGKLAKLETLSLNANPLTQICDCNSSVFAALKSLSLQDIQISLWSSVEQLDQLPALSSLVLQQCTLAGQTGRSQFRQLVIAFLPNLKILNRSQVGDRERKDAEKCYLQKFSPDKIPGNDPALMLYLFKEYEVKNGWNAQPSRTDGDSSTLLNTLVCTLASAREYLLVDGVLTCFIAALKFRSNDALSMTSTPVTKKLATNSVTVATAKQICYRLFKLLPIRQQLYYKSGAGAFPEHLDDDGRTLDYYGITDGGEIIMEKVCLLPFIE